MKPITVTVGGKPLELQPPRSALIWRISVAVRAELKAIEETEAQLPVFWGCLGALVHPDPLPMSWDYAGNQSLGEFGENVYDELRARGWTCPEASEASKEALRAVFDDVYPSAAEVMEARDFSEARSDEAA